MVEGVSFMRFEQGWAKSHWNRSHDPEAAPMTVSIVPRNSPDLNMNN